MKKTILFFFAIFFLPIIITSCKSGTKCSDDTAFCTLVAKEEYDNLGLIIDKYLSKQKKSLSDYEKLVQLRDWLECKSCVLSVKIRCNSCSQRGGKSKSILRIEFKSKTKSWTTDKYLYIIMDNPLQFGSWE